jgi:hypothetical protein
MGAGLNKKAKERLSACKKDGGTELNFTDCSIQDFRNFGPVVAIKTLIKVLLLPAIFRSIVMELRASLISVY